MISITHIKASEVLSLTDLIQELRNKWQWIMVLDSDLVDTTIVYTEPQTAV
jgi:hypothetical protein